MLFESVMRFYIAGLLLLLAGDAEENNVRLPRIVGGKDAIQGEFPYQGAIFIYDNILHCGCSLIHSKWAITATHCTENRKPVDLKLYFGEIDCRKMLSNLPNLHHVLEIHEHPSYKAEGMHHDISLLKLQSIDKSRYVSVIALPKHNEINIIKGKLCTITGWGRTKWKNNKLSDILQKAQVPITSNAKCQAMLSLTSTDICENLKSQVCAGYEKGGVDSCNGDSGGPLACTSTSGTPVLLGITSWGIGCAEPLKPGVYTRVSFYLEWIYDTTQIVGSDQKTSKNVNSLFLIFLILLVCFISLRIIIRYCGPHRRRLQKLIKTALSKIYPF